MIETAEIRHFRGFHLAKLEGLTRVNIVVGDNGAGKTALLEALFLATCSSPEVALRLRGWRGVDAQGITGNAQEIYDGLFLDLFHKFDRTHRPSILATGSGDSTRALQFYYDSDAPTLLPFADANKTQPQSYTPVTFEWRGADGNIQKFTPSIQPNGLVIPPAPMMLHDAAFIAARAQYPTSQNARWFSEFSKRGRETKFISAVRNQFDYVESLTVEVDMGNPTIFVKMPWFETKVPVYLTSDGLNKLLTLLLHIAHSTGTALFVDEVESGFHFSRHSKLWEQFLTFAEEFETQLFFVTHSWEFLAAAAPLMEKFPNDFAMIQVAQERGVGRAIVVPGKNAGAAIANEIEVRGRGDGSGSARSKS